MNNILREIFWAVLMVCLPIATACVKKAAASIGAFDPPPRPGDRKRGGRRRGSHEPVLR